MKKLLIANRGEIALRIIKAAKALGIQTVAIFSEIDRLAPHTRAADEAYCVGPAPALESYLNQKNILKIIADANVDAVHPGYGFLSENPEFAEAVAKQGATFVGPSAEAMRRLGHKDEARKIAENAGVPVVPGYHEEKQDSKSLINAAKKIGFPCILKARAGGGGKGMRRLDSDDNIEQEIDAAKREAMSAFGDERLIVEKFIAPARHIEVQLIADSHGHVLHLFERECSLQRRHQKVIEEAPSPSIDSALREKMVHAAQALATAAGLENASTVEFLVPSESKKNEFYFLEVNCRVQVEHPVTELVTGVDIVQLQLRIARGEKIPFAQKDITLNGSAIEARVYAELPAQHFMPSTGLIKDTNVNELKDDGTRIDHALEAGVEISTFYDPMLAKFITHGESREAATAKLKQKLRRFSLRGVETNQVFLVELLGSEEFVSGKMATSFIDENLQSLIDCYSNEKLFNLAAAVFLHATYGSKFARNSTDPFYSSKTPVPSSAKTDRVISFSNPELPVTIRSLSTGKSQTLTARPASINEASQLFTCEISGEKYEISILEHGTIINGEHLSTSAHAISEPHAPSTSFSIFLEGQTFIAVTQSADSSQSEAQGEDAVEILSPLPGKLVRVDASPGQSVQAGDTLCVIESMKMEHSLRAPRDVVIDSVLLNAGDSVNEGQKIIVFANP